MKGEVPDHSFLEERRSNAAHSEPWRTYRVPRGCILEGGISRCYDIESLTEVHGGGCLDNHIAPRSPFTNKQKTIIQ